MTNLKDLNDSQICGGYSKKSLMGNWYEQRMNKARDEPTTRIIRKVEPNFAFEDNSGIHDLDRLTRLRMPSRNVITNGQRQIDYSTEMKQSIAQSSFNNSRINDRRSIVKFAGEKTLFTEHQPVNVQINYHNRAKLINGNNYPILLQGSHATDRRAIESKPNNNSYVSTYRNNYELPAIHHTEPTQTLQRPQIPQVDIMNSLPLGNGEWGLKPNINTRGYFRHIRSEVTDSPNKSKLYK